MKEIRPTKGLGWSIASGYDVGELVTWCNFVSTKSGGWYKEYENGIITDIISYNSGNRSIFVAVVMPFGQSEAIEVSVFRLRKLKTKTN